ncbi:hypothetical protein [Sphingomonas sp. DT-204]|uniref:hypothetical protein n=1 Tax=Sphingomonas sp. DT-204 TaxID=3396166 RepID=UPI003F1B1F39
MGARRIRSRLLVGSIALIGAAGVQGAQREPTTPPLSAQGIASVRILCLVEPQDGSARALRTKLCEQVRDAAARGAPVPVSAVGFGDPAVLDRSTLTILVHAAVQRIGGEPLLLLGIRPYRSATEGTVLFGPPPVAIPFAGGNPAAPEIRAAIDGALRQSLPWRGPES